jgi:hypothetical protein
MRTRLLLFRLAALGLALTLLLLPNLALAAPETDVCRRLWGTEEWTRRCAPDRPEFDPVAYCRRLWGTDEWTRRCAHLADDDLAAFCRRVWGTDEWTRRCARLVNDDDLAAYCRRVWGTEDWTRRCAVQQPDPPRPEPDLSAAPPAAETSAAIAAPAARGPR